MKVLLKKDIYESREQCMQPTHKVPNACRYSNIHLDYIDL